MSLSFYLNFFRYDNVSGFLQVLFHFYLLCSIPHSHLPSQSPDHWLFLCFFSLHGYLLSVSPVPGTVRGAACTVLRRIDRTCCPHGYHVQRQKLQGIRALYSKGVRVRKAFGIWTSLLIIVTMFHIGYVLPLWLECHFSLFHFYYFLSVNK